MKFNQYFDDISLTPFKKEFEGYSLSALRQDLFAGTSVALLTLPQAMAYALVAHLPLSTALFAAIFSTLIAAIFGSSRHLAVGSSNAIAILIQYGTAEILHRYFRHLTGVGREVVSLEILTQLSLLVAVIQLLASSFKLGRLTQFVSYSVVLGYVMGASAAIIINQLFVFLGIPDMEGIQPLYGKLIYLSSHLDQIHWLTFAIGLGSMALLVGLKRLDRRIPSALIALVLATVFLATSRAYLQNGVHDVKVVGNAGEISGLTPQFGFPHFNLYIMNQLIPVAFAIAMVSILETTAVAKSIASRSGQRLSINQEILGLGFGNLTSAFCVAMPISGSTSRTFLNFECGAKTRLAVIFSACLVGLILYLFEGFVARIPLAALSALLIVTAGNLINKKQLLLCLKATSADAFVFWTTFLSCILFNIDTSFYIGVCLSITLYLKKAAVPNVSQSFVDEEGRIKNLEQCSKEEMTKIRLIKVKGELFFGAADLFQTTLKSIAEDDTNTKVIILQLKNARDIDATACLALKQLHEYLKNSGRHLLLSGLTLPSWDVLSGAGLVSMLGKENLFVINERHPHRYFNRTLKRAQELVEQTEKDGMMEDMESPSTSGYPLGTASGDGVAANTTTKPTEITEIS
ncbi:MAG: SulP family inorganic anion transporter [Waddliaceae bacterium]